MNESVKAGFIDVGCGLPGIQAGIGLLDRNAIAVLVDETDFVVGLETTLPSD